MATGRVPTTANSPLTAKGDLFGYSTTQARVPVGSDGETLVADSSTSTGLRYNPTQAGGRNIIINGNLDFWQRGTTATVTTNGYACADRFYLRPNGLSCTYSRQSTGAPKGADYILRSASNSASSVPNWSYIIESSQLAALRGETVTLSFKARRNASFTGFLTIYIDKSSTVDCPFGGTWNLITSQTLGNSGLPTGTTSADWYFASVTFTIPNDGTANTLMISVSGSAYETTGAYWEMAQMQLEIGSTATKFSRAGGTLAGELAACQRYFYQLNANMPLANGEIRSATTAYCIIKLAQTMRTAPTAVFNNPTGFYVNSAGKSGTAVTIGLDISGTDFYGIAFTGLTGYTAGQSSYIGIGGTGNAQFSSEL